MRGVPSCHCTPVVFEDSSIASWRPRTRVFICGVYFSTPVFASTLLLDTVYSFDPPSDAGEFLPAPELFDGYKVIFIAGVDP